MRFSAAVLLFFTTGNAGASSLVALEPMEARVGPSMVELANGGPSRPSRSVIALDEAVPAVSHEKLSAIGKDPAPASKAPLVIRGGMTGQDR
ncbi:hypothetical protein [Mesorhizobium sp. 1B3]|uniref:hypothetical protein n=1 Tax=Mesorhizobium sp. 1B3 TaxID=3243599 RepID=UPI003D98411B